MVNIMISDLSNVILNYAIPYTKSTTSTFQYGGITYNNVSETSTIYGIMTPIEDTDIEMLTHLGYSIIGKQTLFVSGNEILLTENDVIIDSSGTEWVILPKGEAGYGIEDWRAHGNFVKYIVSRKVL